MATHFRILAWRIPWTEDPGRLQSIGSHRVGHDWSDLPGMHMVELELSTGSLWSQRRGESEIFTNLFVPHLVLISHGKLVKPSRDSFVLHYLVKPPDCCVGCKLSSDDVMQPEREDKFPIYHLVGEVMGGILCLLGRVGWEEEEVREGRG